MTGERWIYQHERDLIDAGIWHPDWGPPCHPEPGVLVISPNGLRLVELSAEQVAELGLPADASGLLSQVLVEMQWRAEHPDAVDPEPSPWAEALYHVGPRAMAQHLRNAIKFRQEPCLGYNGRSLIPVGVDCGPDAIAFLEALPLPPPPVWRTAA